jgi:hypothetical protein
MNGLILKSTAKNYPGQPGFSEFLRVRVGKIAGDQISFLTKSLTNLGRDEKTYEDKHYYKGTVKGDEIVFTMVTDSSIESHTPIRFTASRVKNK